MDDAAYRDLLLSCSGARLPLLAGGLAMSVTPLRRLGPARAPASQRQWARWFGRILSGVLIIAAVLLGGFMYKLYYAHPRTDDAYVHANTASMAAHVSGQIVKLPIADNQHVNKGELL